MKFQKNPKESLPKSANYTLNWHHIINIKVFTNNYDNNSAGNVL